MTILFYIETVFPNGAAWSIRANSFLKLFRKLDYDVHIISLYKSVDYVIKENNFYDDHITLEFVKTNISKFDNFMISKLAYKKITEYLKRNNVDFVISTRSPQIFGKILSFTKKRNISYFVEQCEMFDSSTFLFGKFNPYYNLFNYRMRYHYKKCTGIIAISNYIEEYFKNQGANVIKIPTIIDTLNYNPVYYLETEIIKLVFVGNIRGKKELLKPIFEALKETKNKLHKKITLDIIGPSEKDILENIDGNYELLNDIRDILYLRGKVPQHDVYNYLSQSHFLIFIRPYRQSSQAGFPTKISESLSTGTPVITNKTSDIDKYLEDKTNGYLIDDIYSDSIVLVLNEISNLSHDELMNLRLNARKTALDYFDYTNYVNEFSNFLRLTSGIEFKEED